MDSNSSIVFSQIIVMFLLMAFGYFLYRRRIFNNEITKQLSVLLNTFVLPSCVISAFQRQYDASLARSLGITFVCGVVLFILSIFIANALYRPTHPENYADCRMCAVFSNNGFMALPLLQAMFGATGVFLGSAHIVVMAIVLWTYGVAQLDKSYRFRWTKIWITPGVISAVIGVLLFVTPVSLPAQLTTAINLFAGLNTPLAMLVLGCFLAQVDLKKCVTDPLVWRVGAVRLILLPFITILLLWVIPLDMTAKITLLVGMSAPTAVAAAMFAQIYDTDYLFSTRVVSLSTLLSLITLPATIAIMERLLQ